MTSVRGFAQDVRLPQYYQHCTKIVQSRTSSLRGVYQTLLCVLVMRNIHPVLQGGSGSETTIGMSAGDMEYHHLLKVMCAEG